ncbi:MAG: DUF4446 family protein [Inconstantimicrobium porci]|uniref:DUF4446 family protein n=1 Tax=Inconstantimicrobium porci TaxID=2652291 RepID=UPI002409943E|nr:DUF4446 family protein [Inconstantimicrobium porci]MDD6771339.1 DUF4446 family protein [Inconstantimicrobium porci]MDY5912675.1 DUF4446 family protein [Inconstantimicrobium porci]
MQQVISNIQLFSPYIIIGLSVIVILLFIIVLVQGKAINNIESRYKKMMRGTSTQNLEELIINNLDSINESEEKSKECLKEIEDLKKKTKSCVQKIAITRYKAFEDIGSDLSFSIAMLDENNDGLILTSIFGRNESTTYAKPVDKGISRYDLSEEELDVLNEAINKVN